MTVNTIAGQAVNAVRSHECPRCETPAGQPCQPKPTADHLARYPDAYTAGQLTGAYMTKVLGELVVIDACPPRDMTTAEAQTQALADEAERIAALKAADALGTIEFLASALAAAYRDGHASASDARPGPRQSHSRPRSRSPLHVIQGGAR